MQILRIKCYGPVHDPRSPIDGSYLQSFDVEAHGGRGHAEFTDNPQLALGFLSMQDAWDAFYSQPRSRPIREDGKPNRPLTCFTAEFVWEPLIEQEINHDG